MRLTNSGVKSTETRVTEILLENRNKPIFRAQYNNACLSTGLNIGLFQFSSKISITLVYTTIGQPYILTTLSLENVFIYLCNLLSIPGF